MRLLCCAHRALLNASEGWNCVGRRYFWAFSASREVQATSTAVLALTTCCCDQSLRRNGDDRGLGQVGRVPGYSCGGAVHELGMRDVQQVKGEGCRIICGRGILHGGAQAVGVDDGDTGAVDGGFGEHEGTPLTQSGVRDDTGGTQHSRLGRSASKGKFVSSIFLRGFARRASGIDEAISKYRSS